jgi:hypothetical protein
VPPRGRPRRTPLRGPLEPPPDDGSDILDPEPEVPAWREIPPDEASEPGEGEDDGHRDTIAVRFFGIGERWTAEVTLGPITHELGSFTTASKAMNAAMKFYYEQRPAAKRRQHE